MITVIREALDFDVSKSTIEYVDEDTAILRNARVCGPVSRNGRKYKDKPLDQLTERLNNGLEVFDNHPIGDSNERVTTDYMGHFVKGWRNHEDKGAVWGDLQFMRKHPRANALIYASKNPNVKNLGFSINGRGNQTRSGNTVYVDEFTALYSVDFVHNPATNSGLRESYMNGDDNDFNTKLSETAASLMADPQMDKATKKKHLLALLSMLDDMPQPTTPAMMTEQLRAIPLKAAQEAAKYIDSVSLREKIDTRLKSAKEAGLKDEHITESFKKTLSSASDADAADLISDRVKLLGITEPKSHQRDTAILEQTKQDNPKSKTQEERTKLLDKYLS